MLVNLEQEILINDIIFELNFCWLVFVVTALTFLVFVVALFFASFEKSDNVRAKVLFKQHTLLFLKQILEKVFFLSDVPSLYQVPYILIVTTGKKKQAGTTSNVGIKLRGSKGESLVRSRFSALISLSCKLVFYSLIL